MSIFEVLSIRSLSIIMKTSFCCGGGGGCDGMGSFVVYWNVVFFFRFEIVRGSGSYN